jgi:predicted nucleic acid-binding protein
MVVRTELQAGAERGAPVPDVEGTEWLGVRSLQASSLLPVVIDLGSGEAEAIALALTLRADTTSLSQQA